MSGDESIAAARPLARALRTAGCELVCASYFGTGADTSPFGDDIAFLSIAADDLASQTDWARAGAQNAARRQLPLARCLGHTLLADGLPALAAAGDPYWIPWFAASWRLEQLMRAIQPSHVLVQQGPEGIAKLAVLHASQLGIPTLLWDTAFFPEHLLVDRRGMHFFSPASDIDAEWQRLRDRPLSDAERARLRAFVEAYGPYAFLGAGSYRVEVDIEVLGSRGFGPRLWMDCAAQGGRRILGCWPAPPRLEGVSVLVGRFDLDAPGLDVEARVHGSPGVSVLITAVRFVRLDAAASR